MQQMGGGGRGQSVCSWRASVCLAVMRVQPQVSMAPHTVLPPILACWAVSLVKER